MKIINFSYFNDKISFLFITQIYGCISIVFLRLVNRMFNFCLQNLHQFLIKNKEAFKSVKVKIAQKLIKNKPIIIEKHARMLYLHANKNCLISFNLQNVFISML